MRIEATAAAFPHTRARAHTHTDGVGPPAERAELELQATLGAGQRAGRGGGGSPGERAELELHGADLGEDGGAAGPPGRRPVPRLQVDRRQRQPAAPFKGTK